MDLGKTNKEITLILFGSGHREVLDSKSTIEKIQKALDDADPEAVVVGGAPGFDTLLGVEAVKRCYPVWLILPWKGHPERFGKTGNKAHDEAYAAVMHFAQKTEVISNEEDFPGNWCYFKRNERMADLGDIGLFYFNGEEKGGTYHCWKYTKELKKPIRNIYG